MPIVVAVISWFSILVLAMIFEILEDTVFIFKLVSKNFILVVLVLTFLFATYMIVSEVIKELKYKNESPEDKKKREELKKIKGIGKVKAIQLKAICELSKRMSRPIHLMNVPIRFPSDVSHLLMDELRYEKKELVKVIILNNKNQQSSHR